MKLARIGAFFLSLACAISAMAAEPLALKGIAIGEPTSIERLQDSLGFIAHDAAGNGQGCSVRSCGYGLTTIAGTHAEISLTVDTQARVVSIAAIFPAAAFADIDAALRAKYGKPAGIGQQIQQNLAGARFNVVFEYWTDEAGNKMSVTSHADATRGYLLLQSKSEVDRLAAQRAKAKGDI